MELDDLKNSWKLGETKKQETLNIMELIHQKSKGPLASLKYAFRRQMITIAVLMIVITISNARNLETIPGYVLYFTYLAFCMAIILAFYINYRRTSKMEDDMDKPVKNNLEDYVVHLEQRLKWQYFGSRLVVLLFIVMVEVLPLFYHARMLDKWHAVPPLVRFLAYIFYFLVVYFVSRRVKQRKFGQHLDHLKELLNTLK
jgi:amino acid transporter